jgi:hypothetical protein
MQPGLLFPLVDAQPAPRGVVPGHEVATLRLLAWKPKGVTLTTKFFTSFVDATQLKLVVEAQVVPCQVDPRTMA